MVIAVLASFFVGCVVGAVAFKWTKRDDGWAEGYRLGWAEIRNDITEKVDQMNEDDASAFLAVIDRSFVSLGDDVRGSGMCCKPEFREGHYYNSLSTPTPTTDNGGADVHGTL